MLHRSFCIMFWSESLWPPLSLVSVYKVNIYTTHFTLGSPAFRSCVPNANMFPASLPIPYTWLATGGVVLTAVTVAVLYYLSVCTVDKWKKLGVPYARPVLPLFGNFLNVALCIDTPADTYRTVYNQLAGHRYGGFYQMRTPYLMIRDPELINHVFRKDFESFPDRGIHTDIEVNPLSNNLFFMDNPKWKVIRSKMSPAFTSGKLKQMYVQIRECGDAMMVDLRKRVKRRDAIGIDIRDVMGRYSK